MMKRIITALLISSLLPGYALAVGTKSAVYIGGTNAELNQRKEAPEGKLDLSNDQTLTFSTTGATISVPYDHITELEYQRTGKYRTTAIGGVVALGFFIFPPFALIALPFALKKKKKHFLTVAYKEADDKGQALVLELGKDIEKQARAIIAARSGKQVNVVVD